MRLKKPGMSRIIWITVKEPHLLERRDVRTLFHHESNDAVDAVRCQQIIWIEPKENIMLGGFNSRVNASVTATFVVFMRDDADLWNSRCKCRNHLIGIVC